MLKYIVKFLLWIFGWKANPNYPPESSYCVMTAAPHTSNWDTFFLKLGLWELSIPMRFTIKDSWTKFPLGLIIKPLGGMGIDRGKAVAKKIGYVDQMAEMITSRDEIAMVIAVEGSRSLRKRWKMGFYHTAMKAKVPICLGYLDYKKKEAGIGPAIYPTGNIEEDMKKMLDFYKDITPKYPEKWCLDERYV